MNICVVSMGFPYPGIPFLTFVGELCKALAAQGENITVVAPQSITKSFFRHNPMIPYKYQIIIPEGKNIMVYTPKVISVGTLPFLGRKINYFFTQRAITKTIKKEIKDVDVFYGHFFFQGYHALPEAIRRNKPIVVASGETEVTFRKEYTKHIDVFLDHLKGIICVSSKNKEEAIAAGLTDGINCIVLPNSVDNNLFRKLNKKECRETLGFPQDDFIVAFVGYFTHRKGSRRVSDAITMLHDEHVKSVFIGRNNDGEDVEPNCEGILFKGSMDHEKIPAYLSAADVFVLPTRAEGCPNAVVEALACGLPVVSSDRKFNYDVCDETNSILVEPDDVEAISQAIKKLKDNPDLRESLSRGALAKAEGLTISERAKKIISFIKKQIDYKID